MMKNPLVTLGPNLVGRDFVITDLHGAYSIFLNLLKNINFDPTVDRILCAGDLVDRGPHSLKCLELIRQPWFHSVRANHEHLMLLKFNDEPQGEFWYRNGGQWGIEAVNDYRAAYHDSGSNRIPSDSSMEIIDLLPLVEQLPFLITVTTRSGKKYHILHAELPPSTETITDEVLADPVSLYRLATTQTREGDAFLWWRWLFNPFYEANLQDKEKIIRTVKYHNSAKIFNKDLSHIISGHTVLQRPMTIVGQTNIDTGASQCYVEPMVPYGRYTPVPPWAALTCIELDAWKFYKVTETTFSETTPLVITEHDLVG